MPASRSRRLIRPIATGAALVLVAYWLVAAFIFAVDPYDLYRWGKAPVIGGDRPPAQTLMLLRAVAKDPSIDLVLFGGSGAEGYSTADLQAAFGAANPVNTGYSGPRPRDQIEVLNEFASAPTARRYVLWFDWIYSLKPQTGSPAFPYHHYDRDPLNDLEIVSPAGVRAAVRTLRDGTPFADDPAYRAWRIEDYEMRFRWFQSERQMRRLRGLIQRHRRDVSSPTDRTCADFPSLGENLLPTLRRMAGHAERIDIVFSPYSPAYYYSLADRPAFQNRRAGDARFADQLVLRRCLVEATAGLPNVTVTALDRDTAQIEDLANYWDDGHLHGEAKASALRRIGLLEYRVTTENVGDYLEALRHSVQTYEVFNSNPALDPLP